MDFERVIDVEFQDLQDKLEREMPEVGDVFNDKNIRLFARLVFGCGFYAAMYVLALKAEDLSNERIRYLMDLDKGG